MICSVLGSNDWLILGFLTIFVKYMTLKSNHTPLLLVYVLSSWLFYWVIEYEKPSHWQPCLGRNTTTICTVNRSIGYLSIHTLFSVLGSNILHRWFLTRFFFSFLTLKRLICVLRYFWIGLPPWTRKLIPVNGDFPLGIEVRVCLLIFPVPSLSR